MATVEADVLGSRLDAAARPGMGDGGVTVSTSRDVARTNSGDDATSSALVASRSSSVGGFLQKPIVRTALPYLGIGLVILLAIVVYATMSASPPRSLYPSMADADKEQAQQLLTKNGVDVSLDPLTGALQVPASEFHEARIMLAAAGPVQPGLFMLLARQPRFRRQTSTGCGLTLKVISKRVRSTRF